LFLGNKGGDADGTEQAEKEQTRPAADCDESLSSIELERRAFRRRQALKSVFISVVSSVVFVLVVVLVLSNSPGWVKVREAFFNPQYFRQAFVPVLKGLMINIEILCYSAVGVAISGTLIAAVRTSRSPVLFPLRSVAAIFTDLMRGTPIIVLILIIGFGVPGLGLTKTRISPVLLGTIVITMAYSAYVAEVLRAGIQSVHPSQRAAARSLGLGYGQTLWLIVLPQAVRRVIPPLMNDFVSMQKDVGLVSLLGVVDAVRAAQIQVAHHFNFTPYVTAAFLFICISWPFIRLTDYYSERVRRRQEAAGMV